MSYNISADVQIVIARAEIVIIKPKKLLHGYKEMYKKISSLFIGNVTQ